MGRTLSALFLLCLAAPAPAGELATITLVDGDTLKAEFLFEHPNAPLVVLRSPQNRSVQSLPLAMIHTVEAEGEVKRYGERREFTEVERTTWQRNGAWPDMATNKQIGRYAGERWEARPVMVWAKPGATGNGLQAENWLDERGRPYGKGPWTRYAGEAGHVRGKPKYDGYFDGDVLIPSAAEPYAVVQPGNRDHLRGYKLRHLTVEANGSYQVRYHVQGNLWMKDGSQLGRGTQTGDFGAGEADKHTVARFCNSHEEPDPEFDRPRWPYAPTVSHWMYVDTGPEGSLEIVGDTRGPGDRLYLTRGTLVVSEDSYLGNGNRAAYYARKGTRTILLDGARIGCPDRLLGGSRGKRGGTYAINGLLLFGTPDHPLTRDLPFGAALYPRDSMDKDGKSGARAYGAAYVLGESGRMEIHSADPTRARVIFRPRPLYAPVSQYVIPRDLWKYIDRRGKTYYPPDPALWDQPEIPDGLAAIFRGETDFNGVVFDGFYKGGIFVDPAQRKQWKNVSFGENNHAPPEELFANP